MDAPIASAYSILSVSTNFLYVQRSRAALLASLLFAATVLPSTTYANVGGTEKDAEVKRLTEQLQKLQTEQIAAIATKDNEIAALKASHAKQTMDMLVTAALAGKNYANDKVAQEANINYARFVIESALKEKGAIIVNDNGTLKLKQAAAPELDYLDEGHKPVTFSGLSDQILAQAGCLKATEQEQHKNMPPVNVTVPADDKRNFESYDAAMKASMEALG